MANLKNKLAQKVEIIESDNTTSVNGNSSFNNDTSNYICDASDKVILLKQPENNQTVSIMPDFAISINEAKERISMLQKFVKEMMIPSVDYGLIPKCDKPSLFKPGAEKLCDIFGFSKQVEVINRVEDWQKGLFHYEVKAILINKRTGLIEAEGIGACNNKERKYQSQDSFSIINTILKMAKKRALIDAVLSATRSSGIFTQDIEDVENDSVTSKSTINTKMTNNFKPINNSKSGTSKELIHKEQQVKIFSLITDKKLPIVDIKLLMKQRYNVIESKFLTEIQANDFISFLSDYEII